MTRESFSPEEAERELLDIGKLKDEFMATDDLARAKELKAELQSRMEGLRLRVFPLERELHLRAQYESQKKILEDSGIIATLPSGEKGITGIEGKPYPLPSYREVLSRLREKKDILQEKKEQGFTRMILVPFGMRIDDLMNKYGELLLRHHQEGKLFAAKEKPADADEPLDLDESEPVWRWSEYNNADVEGRIVYDPKTFTKENHGGRTKQEMLGLGQAWRVVFVEGISDIPREGKGKTAGAAKKRRQIEADRTPNDYLSLIGKGQYEHESGTTPEDWLALAITELEEKNRVIDDWQGQGSIAYNTGSWFPASGRVPYADWVRGDRRAYLNRLGPSIRYSSIGARSAVRA